MAREGRDTGEVLPEQGLKFLLHEVIGSFLGRSLWADRIAVSCLGERGQLEAVPMPGERAMPGE
jgi:hypothetical protein